MKPFHPSISFLFAFLLLPATTMLQAQVNFELGISLSHDRLPFAEMIAPVPQEKEWRGSKTVYDFPNGKDSIAGMMDLRSEWHLSYVYCRAQWGMMLQSQAYSQNAIYSPADTSIVLSGADICAAFSADSSFTLNQKVHTTFNSPDQQEGEWFITQWGDVLLVKLFLDLLPAKPDNNLSSNPFYSEPDYPYHREEYWYFFQRAG